MAQSRYEVRVAGTVPAEDLDDMRAVRIESDPVDTVLYGVADQAALFGLLTRLRGLGIDVVEVRRVGEVGEIAEMDDVEGPGKVHRDE
ncbi:hypothetical protein N865_15115 [Intrasporangium oryzae NRRL B-24470]|uniref:Uncharacterized protein n=1 Tax=Intrasporangium oryzae NRRL B-24470 TaxID=1386089 RepID=W9G8P2_9MICO|nr:hypothetical protein [Intrasporangium oryzae]EWT01617.1 hypothetical protein N865_15115 [Intrasporangium oryzae NRRL B-24470]